jgi:hypothetical protein
MKLFVDAQKCIACEKFFDWKYTKVDNGEFVVCRQSEMILNAKRLSETEAKYILELQCPMCSKRQFVELDK